MHQNIDGVDAGENYLTRARIRIFTSFAGFNKWINQ